MEYCYKITLIARRDTPSLYQRILYGSKEIFSVTVGALTKAFFAIAEILRYRLSETAFLDNYDWHVSFSGLILRFQFGAATTTCVIDDRQSDLTLTKQEIKDLLQHLADKDLISQTYYKIIGYDIL